MRIFIKNHRFFIATMATSFILLIIIAALFSIDNSTNEMIVDYLSELGWQVEPSPVEITHITIPSEFDAVYETYNAVQLSSGFNLEKFKGKQTSRYSYKVKNHKESVSMEVLASVFVYENTIIAGDICSTTPGGFMHSLKETSNIVN